MPKDAKTAISENIGSWNTSTRKGINAMVIS